MVTEAACSTGLNANQSSNDLTLRKVFECICVGAVSQNTVALRCAICQGVDAQALVNTRVRIRCCFPEPCGASIPGFTDLDKAILADSGLKLLKGFHGNFSLRAPDSRTLT